MRNGEGSSVDHSGVIGIEDAKKNREEKERRERANDDSHNAMHNTTQMKATANGHPPTSGTREKRAY